MQPVFSLAKPVEDIARTSMYLSPHVSRPIACYKLYDIIYAMKKASIDNPFLLAGYESPEYFCDRERELGEMLEAVGNGRNMTLLSPRRMGKTGLIHHLFHTLRREGKWTPIYVDIFTARNLADFARRLAVAVIGSMDSKLDKALSAATGFFRSFRPTVSIDPLTGAPSYSFTLEPSRVEATLKECFDYLGARGRRSVVAIDEFQQVAEFPEKGTEALLRSYVQFLPQTRFIFAGSKRHMRAEMFSAPNRPFFNSTQTMPLGPIDSGKYLAFARRHLKKAGVALEADVFGRVFDAFDGRTWNVQAVLNRFYARRSARMEDFEEALDWLVENGSYYYGTLIESLPDGAVRLLRAIAAEGRVSEPTAGGFMARHALRASASVRLSLKKLIGLGLVCRDAGGYAIEDRMFSLWLARQG